MKMKFLARPFKRRSIVPLHLLAMRGSKKCTATELNDVYLFSRTVQIVYLLFGYWVCAMMGGLDARDYEHERRH